MRGDHSLSCAEYDHTQSYTEETFFTTGSLMPTDAQLRCLYRIGYQLTYMLFQPIHLICIDGQTQNLYILAGQNEEIEFEITPDGEVL